MYGYNFEKIFSYWIFAWFIIYFISLKLFSIKIPNPYLTLCVALFINICELSYTIINYIKNRESNMEYVKNTAGYVAVTFVIKVIPILILINIKKNKYNINDIYFTLVLLVFYFIFNHLVNGKTWWRLFDKHPEYPAGNPPISIITPTIRSIIKL